MAKGNHVSVRGDITGDIYFDILDINGQTTPFLRLYMMINGSREAYPVKGLRICMYGVLAELTYAYVQKGSRIYVEGHVQTRLRRNNEIVVEVVAEDVDFIRNIDCERGSRIAEELRKQGLLNTGDQDGSAQLASISLGYGGVVQGIYDTLTEQSPSVLEDKEEPQHAGA